MSGTTSQDSVLGLYDWSFEEHKAFELALATNIDKADRWERAAECVSNRTPQEVHCYFLQLEDDVRRIDLGLVPIPTHYEQQCTPAPPQPLLRQSSQEVRDQRMHASVLIDMPLHRPPPPPQPSPKKIKLESSNSNAATPNAQADKRKGVPWTEEEHKLFLLGLAKFGKGDWRSIARNYVVSRTPTQVASHAQKYFIRLNSANKKDKRRASIHDITSASLAGEQFVC